MPAQRFVLRKQKLARKTSAVEVGSHVVVDQRYFFKQPVRISMEDVGGVVRLRELEDSDVVPAREVRELDLPSSQYTDPNVALFFRTPVRVPRFRFGAQQQLRISGKERRRGAAFDSLTVTAEDPDGLVRALETRGVQRFASISEALRGVFGEATRAEAEVILAKEDKELRKAKLMQLGWGVLFSIAVVARFVLPAEDDGSFSGSGAARIFAGAAVVATITGLIAARITSARVRALEPRRTVADSLDWRKAAGMVALPLGALGVVWLGIYLASYIDAAAVRHFVFGAVLGGPLGVLTGVQLGLFQQRKR